VNISLTPELEKYVQDKVESGLYTSADFAKRLLDYSVHAPTVYFPLMVPECLLIEPIVSEHKILIKTILDIDKIKLSYLVFTATVPQSGLYRINTIVR
jgi:hypothetical protein